jgi:hypothetical protein
MTTPIHIAIVGTGAFAARILFDLAATAGAPTRIAVIGRNTERLAWLVTAARARGHMYGRPVSVMACRVDGIETAPLADVLDRLLPKVVLQAASLQSGAVIARQGNAWARLVASGGLSASAVFQCVLSARVARGCRDAVPGAAFVNACFPDVVNTMIAAMDLPVTCGIGNIQILAHAFAGTLAGEAASELRLLAHYQNLAAWRRPLAERQGANARAWIGDRETADVLARFAEVQLTPEPVIDISGAAAAPLMMALAHKLEWRGHAPGPAGLPGGYPVRAANGALELDLPAAMTQEAAVAWNLAHEETGGLVVDGAGRARYTGRLETALASHSPELARGFHVRDIEAAHDAMQQLRTRLQS